VKFRSRQLDRGAEAEIRWVASHMKQTLVEVLGQEKGSSLYTDDWLINRVRWHLDPNLTTAKVLIVEQGPTLVAHAIARTESDSDSSVYGYFSTIFVLPEARHQGIASSLILEVEAWFKTLKMKKIVYHTAEDHSKVIRLFERHGFTVTHRENQMVQLTKLLAEG
jgi:GNAT superfamily N-acetyltransferase